MATTSYNYNVAAHKSALMVEWVSQRLFEVCDYDGHGLIGTDDLSDLADVLEIPEDFEDFDTVDDLHAIAEIANGLFDCYRVDDFDDTDGTVYVTSLERVQEIASERTYRDDVDAEYNAATGF